MEAKIEVETLLHCAHPPPLSRRRGEQVTLTSRASPEGEGSDPPSPFIPLPKEEETNDIGGGNGSER